jgi:hypothetical protein
MKISDLAYKNKSCVEDTSLLKYFFKTMASC